MRKALALLSVMAAYVLTASLAAAGPITTQSVSSQVDSGGVNQLRDDRSATDGYASSQALWPPGIRNAQARTAARSSIEEIAANARVFSDTLADQLQIDLALSEADYYIDIPVGSTPLPSGLDFFLPPSYIEIVSNAELAFNVMTALFFADLRVCQDSHCSANDQVFFFLAEATGSFRSFNYRLQSDNRAGLDLTPLENPTVTQTVTGLLRTDLVEFPDYVGRVDLTGFSRDLPLRVEYALQARASGFAVLSSAIAAINDPFVLDSDPIRQGAPIRLIQRGPSSVPEPASVMLCLVGVVFKAVRRSRRGNTGRARYDLPRSSRSSMIFACAPAATSSSVCASFSRRV